MMWDWPGYFSLDVPEGWSVLESDGLVEITPQRPTGAVTISVVTASTPASTDAAEVLLVNFAKAQGAHPPAALQGDLRGAGWISFKGAGGLLWDVRIAEIGGRLVRASYCHGDEDEATHQIALSVLSSLRPSPSQGA